MYGNLTGIKIKRVKERMSFIAQGGALHLVSDILQE